MTLPALGVRSSSPLGRRNPVAKMAGALCLSLPLLATVDPLTPAIALGVELAALPLFGLSYWRVVVRMAPLLLSVLGLVLSLLIFAGERTGAVVFTVGPLVLTTGVLNNALALSLRLIAVALPGVLVFATTDPTDLADALVQNVKAPARFAIGTLAAFRLLPLLEDQWRMLRLARRARGIDGGANPLRHLRLAATSLFGLLVIAIRLGTRLATAMDARGFDSTGPRTFARTQRFGWADAALVLACAVAGAAAVTISLVAGTFEPLLA